MCVCVTKHTKSDFYFVVHKVPFLPLPFFIPLSPSFKQKECTADRQTDTPFIHSLSPPLPFPFPFCFLSIPQHALIPYTNTHTLLVFSSLIHSHPSTRVCSSSPILPRSPPSFLTEPSSPIARIRPSPITQSSFALVLFATQSKALFDTLVTIP